MTIGRHIALMVRVIDYIGEGRGGPDMQSGLTITDYRWSTIYIAIPRE